MARQQGPFGLHNTYAVLASGMLAAAGWPELPAATHAEVGARLASTGALRSLDAALRLVARHGTVADLEKRYVTHTWHHVH